MAATATKLSSSLIIKYIDGVDPKGKEIVKKQSFSKIKTSAAEQDLFDIAKEIEKLIGKTLDEVIREDQNSITNI